MPNETGQYTPNIHDRAANRLSICRDLTDEAQADCEVIRDLNVALAAMTARAEAAEKQRDTSIKQLEMFDDFFCCPMCCSYQIKGISFDDDFGSHKCDDCGHQGEPGEDFPTTLKIRERLKAAGKRVGELEEVLGQCRDHLDGCSHGYSDDLWDAVHDVSTREAALAAREGGE